MLNCTQLENESTILRNATVRTGETWPHCLNNSQETTSTRSRSL